MPQPLKSDPRQSSLAGVTRSHEEHYRHYRLLAGSRGGSPVAVAYEGRTQAFVETGQDAATVLENLKQRIDTHLKEQAGRRGEEAAGEADYLRALNLTAPGRSEVEWHIVERVRSLAREELDIKDLRSGPRFEDDTLVLGLQKLGRKLDRILADCTEMESAQPAFEIDKPKRRVRFEAAFLAALADHIRQ